LTPAEKSLWRLLRADGLDGHKFRRQVAIGPYVVDFACLPLKLIIDSTASARRVRGPRSRCPARDLAHRARLSRHPFWNHDLDENIHAVVDQIRGALAEQAERITPP